MTSSVSVASSPPPAPAKPATAPAQTRVIGVPRAPLRDVYHALLRAPWWAVLGIIVGSYLALNALFACVYLLTGGVANVEPGSFLHAFYFSVQTMGTIGYGAFYPESDAANAVVVAESVVGLLATALATGLVFARFSRLTPRVVFSRTAAIGPMDGVPTLMIRLGNERSNQIMEATIRVALVRTEHTKEGVTFYRMYDLKLSRDRSPALARSWTVMHPIEPGSPLYGQTPASLAQQEVELIVTVVGVDDTSLQPVHARKGYADGEIVWGARHADILTEEPSGDLVADLRRFHELTPTKPTEDFPYPAAG